MRISIDQIRAASARRIEEAEAVGKTKAAEAARETEAKAKYPLTAEEKAAAERGIEEQRKLITSTKDATTPDRTPLNVQRPSGFVQRTPPVEPTPPAEQIDWEALEKEGKTPPATEKPAETAKPAEKPKPPRAQRSAKGGQGTGLKPQLPPGS